MADLLDRRFSGLNPLKAQIARLARLLPSETSRLEMLRIGQGVTFTTLAAACRRLNLADRTSAVFAVAAAGASRESLVTRAERLADTIAEDDCLAAVLTHDGKVLGASGGYDALAPAESAIDALVAAAAGARDGLAKQTIAVGRSERPAGVARFTAGDRDASCSSSARRKPFRRPRPNPPPSPNRKSRSPSPRPSRSPSRVGAASRSRRCGGAVARACAAPPAAAHAPPAARRSRAALRLRARPRPPLHLRLAGTGRSRRRGAGGGRSASHGRRSPRSSASIRTVRSSAALPAARTWSARVRWPAAGEATIAVDLSGLPGADPGRARLSRLRPLPSRRPAAGHAVRAPVAGRDRRAGIDGVAGGRAGAQRARGHRPGGHEAAEVEAAPPAPEPPATEQPAPEPPVAENPRPSRRRESRRRARAAGG